MLFRSMIFDCGAWSYKDEEEPTVTPKQALDKYMVNAPNGSMLIAPDHMVIPGKDNKARRQINRRNAAEFIGICPKTHTPMATVHGETIDDRIQCASELYHHGYRHIALGGMAAQASRKALMVEAVERVRDAVPDVWLHVLGLSSPSYVREWKRLGVQSCDGSSHFKQAFTGGAFFTHDGKGKLTKHQAARPGNADDLGIVAPVCHCKACSLLRDDGVDTRSYGSNEHNMGRAAHNMNMLMQAQKEMMRLRVVLVACCGEKLSHPAPAKDLYQSELFKKSRTWAESNGDKWLILSAKLGVIHPEQVVEPYDETLNDKKAGERAEWSRKVAQQLGSYSTDRLVVLAGKNYCGWVEGFDVERPMEGMGIGQQLAWLKAQNSKEQHEQSVFDL